MGVTAHMDIRVVLKKAIVEKLNLEDVSPEQIADDAPLFGDGLGLDSLDAIELVVLVKQYFGVELEDSDETKQAFASINALVSYIETHRN
jgi:acyl carrier protein